MDHRASSPAPARRARGIVLVGLAILGVVIAAFVVPRSLVAPAPSSSATEAARTTGTQPPPDEPDHALADGVVDWADGLVPDWVAVSVFDEEMPAVGRLDPDLLDALQRAAVEAGSHGVGLGVNSGWRSPEYQRQLWQDAVVEHGSPEAAARWVATVETSAHVAGDAVDVGPAGAAAWLDEHGAAHGLCRIYDNEPWHYELRPDAVHGGCPPTYADPTEDPRMQA